MTDNWRSPQTMGDLLTSYDKRISSLERRGGAASTIVDIVGVAQNKRATLIDNWDAALASDNGYFWSRPGALHSPDPLLGFTGSVIGRSDNSGMQQVWNTDDLNDVRYFMRTYTDDGTGQGRTYSNWRAWSTPSGLVELTDLGETVQDYLNELAAEIDAAAPSLLFFEQAGEPVPGVSGVPATIPVGSSWIDTDDNHTLYIWNGTAWASAESTLFADLAAADAALTLQVEDAAGAAADAMDFAVTLTKVYRQNTAPSNPDADGRTLVADDVWFDQDDSNKMYTWSGSAWVLLGISTESYAASQASAAQAAAIAAAAADATTKAGAAQSAAIAAAAADATTKAAAAVASANNYYDTNIVTITGSTIQTTATAARGVKLTSGGLTAYNGSGVATLVINASTGAITMLGDLTSGSTVTGAVVTGGTLQSEATAARGIKITSGGLTAYNSSGVTVTTINATTGAITTTGPVLSGGTITGPTIKTSVSASTGIEIVGNVLTAFASGSPSVVIDGDDGFLSTTNGIFTGGTISGMVVTGGTVQSEATAARGIKLNSAGLTAYNGSGTPTFTVTAATGAVTLAGSLTGAGVITGPTLRGGLWETDTAGTANKGIKVTSAGLIAYDGAGGTSLFIDAATGVLTVSGGVLTGGSLTGGVVTGAVLQTEATAARGIKMNSTGLVVYDSVAGSPTLGQATLAITAATGAVDMLGKLTATSFTLLDSGQFYGTSALAGTINLTNGVPDPSVAPTVTETWPAVSLGSGYLTSGVISVTDNAAGTHWLVLTSTLMLWVNQSTLAVDGTVTAPTQASFGAYRAFVRTSSGYWGLYKHSTSGWKAEKYTTSGVGNLVDTGTTTDQLFTINPANNYSLVFGVDGADIIWAEQATAAAGSAMTVSRVTPVVNTLGSPAAIATIPWGFLTPLHYVGYGSFDLGTTRVLVGGFTIGPGTPQVRSFNTSGVEQTSESFNVDPKGFTTAMIWDATRFWSFDNVGISKHSTHITASNIVARYAWEDVNAVGGTGLTHKTGSSPPTPSTGTYTWSRRTYLKVLASPPPQTTTGPDDANVVRFYLGTSSGGTCFLQTVQPSFGSNSAIYETIVTSGTAHPTVSTFGTLGVTGIIASANFSAGVAGWRLKGDGTEEHNGTGWLRPGAAGGPTWGAGWSDNDPSGEAVVMRKIGTTVEVRGLAWRTSGSGLLLFTLPVGSRPSRSTYRPALISGSWAYLNISTSGDVTFAAGGTNPVNSANAVGFEFKFDTNQPA